MDNSLYYAWTTEVLGVILCLLNFFAYEIDRNILYQSSQHYSKYCCNVSSPLYVELNSSDSIKGGEEMYIVIFGW